jgi:hypothetical protein
MAGSILAHGDWSRRGAASSSTPEPSPIDRVRSGLLRTDYHDLAASYIADAETKLCFLMMEVANGSYDSAVTVTAVDCCALYRSPRMRPAVPWLSDAGCAPVAD